MTILSPFVNIKGPICGFKNYDFKNYTKLINDVTLFYIIYFTLYI